jgi:hypothetical protein
VPAQATVHSSARLEPEKQVDFGSHEPSFPSVSTIACAQAAVRNKGLVVQADSSACDASLTYLRTQRLRL